MNKIYFLFILFTSNNIFLTFTNYQGRVVLWSSLGKFKTKGLRKLTPALIKSLVNEIKFNFKFFKYVSLHIKMKGFNKCKKNLLKFIFDENFFNILSIIDYSLNSHNGCKLKKSRRL